MFLRDLWGPVCRLSGRSPALAGLFNAPRRIAGSEGLTSLPPVESGVACGGRGVRQPMRLAERDNDPYRRASPLNFRFSEYGNAVIYDDGNGVCLLVGHAGKLSLNWLITPT